MQLVKFFPAILGSLLFFAAAAPTIAQVLPPTPRPRDASLPSSSVTMDIPAPPSKAQPMVLSARIGEHDDRTRFVIELSDPVKLRVFTLSNPNRVVIDLPEVLWRIQGGPQKPSGFGAIKSYRYGLYRPGNSRFVIDLNMPVNVTDPLVLPPQDGFGYRVVLDLFPTAQAAFSQKSGWPADLQKHDDQIAALLAAEKPAKKTAKKIIVIDAGHGGIDTGTSAADGSAEKDLVLDEAVRLGKELRKRGYTVFLTRDTDTYIPLRERVAISRSHGADLFVSLHADSNPDTAVNGASVYSLSESGSDKEAAALAKKENQSDIIAGVDLSGDNSQVAPILLDLAQRDTMNRSSRFAETVVKQLSSATDVLARTPHRSAAFVVLKAPDVPAVLVELGYLSNHHDSSQMGTAEWRDGVAGALANAVDRQFRAAPAATDPIAARAASD
ncbi:MAG: N-acetylmuramoyl-L-alanine amidase [Proteobacteria bacterium]|nr:N-acetylmuramoyl-L-alanine amidase [Pseudomonadota bacterium]